MKKKLLLSLLTLSLLLFASTTAFAQTSTLDLENSAVYSDGRLQTMERVAFAKDNSIIMVPVRDVAALFGGTVVYDPADNTVAISFTNGNWAVIYISDEELSDGETLYDENGDIRSFVSYIDNHIYIPAEVMATIIGGKVECISWGQDAVYRLIFHVR